MADGFQRHVAGALHGPLVVLFEQDCADKADDSVVVGGDANDLGATLVLAVEMLDGIGAVQLGTMPFRKGHVTDPPRSVVIEGNVSRLGKVKHKKFAIACGEMSPEQFKDFNKAYLSHANEHLMDGALAYVFMDGRTIGALYTASYEANDTIADLVIWDRGSGGMGSDLRSQHQPCLIIK